MKTFSIEGMDNLKRIFEEFPEKGYRKPVIAAFRKAAEPVKRAMIARLPGNLRSLRKAIKIKPGKGKSMTLTVGMFANEGVFRNTRGITWDPYQILYWHNYGTLAKRDSSHTFKFPRRKKTAQYKGGITPGRYMEKAWEESKYQAQQEFEKMVEAETTKFLEQNAYK